MPQFRPGASQLYFPTSGRVPSSRSRRRRQRWRLPATRPAIVFRSSLIRLAELIIDPETGRADLATPDCLNLLTVCAAAGTERTRFYLNGVYLHNIAGRLTAIGMDGTKALMTSVVADDVLSTDDRLIIPMPTVTMLIRLLRQTRPDRVLLRRSRTVFSASTLGFGISSGLIDFRYPDYRAALPKAGANAATCQRGELLGALARLKAVAFGEFPLVALTWSSDEPMRVFVARQPDAGTEPISASATGAARKAFSLPQLVALVSEFSDNALVLEAGDLGLIIRQGDTFGALAECTWHEKQAAA